MCDMLMCAKRIWNLLMLENVKLLDVQQNVNKCHQTRSNPNV